MGRRRQPDPEPEPVVEEEAPPLEKNQPARTIRSGRIRIVIWRNETDEGRPWFSSLIHRTYRVGEEYRTAHSFGFDDLLVIAELSRQAWLWIASQTGPIGTSPEGTQSTGDDGTTPF